MRFTDLSQSFRNGFNRKEEYTKGKGELQLPDSESVVFLFFPSEGQARREYNRLELASLVPICAYIVPPCTCTGDIIFRVCTE